MLKRLVIIGAAVGGAIFLRNKAKQQQAEQDLWTAATDDVQAPVAPAAPAATQVSVPADAAADGDEAPAAS
ncbi:hypothetical protein FHX52_3701 [Humibacillus xanthopallidus]|uniref:Uncharacterized protein n=1 Tax=Humibacillus xanthopallidus TaxID=412689 RepID=A0A543PK89_9MICO|nr:DLW-39 family protein [Humibacillus xanthopallidus]TQN44487.1 hypothetical protein FHX52_3701 [Humibacillus xanthopallidus]